MDSGPPDEGNEHQLKPDSWNGRCRGRPSERDTGACRMDIGRQDGNEKQDERNGRHAARPRHEEADGAEDFADAGEGHHQCRVRDGRRYHSNQVSAHTVEMCGGGEAQHHGKANPGRGRPVPKRRHAKAARQPGKQRDDHQYDQWCHT